MIEFVPLVGTEIPTLMNHSCICSPFSTSSGLEFKTKLFSMNILMEFFWIIPQKGTTIQQKAFDKNLPNIQFNPDKFSDNFNSTNWCTKVPFIQNYFSWYARQKATKKYRKNSTWFNKHRDYIGCSTIWIETLLATELALFNTRRFYSYRKSYDLINILLYFNSIESIQSCT